MVIVSEFQLQLVLFGDELVSASGFVKNMVCLHFALRLLSWKT